MNTVKYSKDLSKDDSLLFIHQSIKSIEAILESAISEEFMKPFVNDLFLKILLTYENCSEQDIAKINKCKIDRLKSNKDLSNGLFIYNSLCELRKLSGIEINII